MSSSAGQGTTSPWGTPATSTLGSSLTDTFGQSRTHYQPGYLMSAQQYNAMPQNTQHTDEIPTVQTKAKMNLALSRGGAPHFGTDSMFESSTGQRQPFADMDAPPTASIHDVFGDTTFGMSAPPQKRFSLDNSTFPSPSRTPRSETTPTSAPVYVVVFGYPPDKYSITVEYFKSLGATTDPEPNTEIVNCFRIGYRDTAEATRAIRRNGEVLTGTYMIGVKWADPLVATELVSSSRQSEFTVSTSPNHHPSHPMAVDSPPPHTSVGTPIRLVPSTAAFRKPGLQPGATPTQKPAVPAPLVGTPGQSPSARGVISQVTDLLFGW
ncbi:hypothetical protein BKA82DRAFT_135533 [Pisolithus tinctorius]|uniref:RRM Nup35-type domain-containing protein n=1 Tax=Pisolithus tinctorius Marx 270 TaxID=870435 RepID=A0A0C3KDV8_PISTI|nr:hypothetical protein BKA82DRAFT_135533 [Pisolithus tinctorius]KIO07797.1 hypothetical protein M404DRAFT_135533 [Pisolithus tinctorius Marx 270]